LENEFETHKYYNKPMRGITFIVILTAFFISCNKAPDMASIYYKERSAFRKIENPTKLNKRYTIDESNFVFYKTIFDSIYLINLKLAFISSKCNVAYIRDGDVLIGRRGSLNNLYYTKRNTDESIQLLNFIGTLAYLLENGKTKAPPYAIKIDEGWYVVHDVQLL
jgi:hypothetical protein